MAENKKKKKEFKQVAMDDGKKILCFITGIIAGNTVGNVLDGILKADELDPTTGKPKVLKKAIAPALLTGAGMFGAYQFQENELIKYVSLGVAGAGITRGVKVFIKKDLLDGLNFGKAAPVSGLGEAEQIAIKTFMPDLPPLNGDEEYDEEGNPIAPIPPRNLNLQRMNRREAMKMLNGDEYQELLGNPDENMVM